MPSNSLLFSLNNEGRVYALSTNGSFWREFMYLGIEFKTLSAIPHFLWAVGGDRQIYVHVHGLEIPIRVKEEAYENERWLPIEGFCNRLLPTDRYHFSSQDGTVDRAIDRIRLPSMAWQWEGDWQLDLTLDGQPLDHDGWSYAIDFPAQFGPTKKWKSCVRRRKWVRYRKYSAMNSWCAIAPLHKDPTQEPFIDVSIGGNQIPHAPASTLTVWAITAHGRVMFRSGVSSTAPEGLRWTNIAIPPSSDVKQISVGPTGLVWALLWTGRCLVRKGVTRTSLHGESWLEIKSPNDTKLSVISVGYDSVWALSSDGRVWFRKGINGNGAGVSEGAAMGNGWLEIGGNMTHLSVAPNDQVFGVGESDKIIYWRFGITPTELSGKRWKCLEAPLHLSRASSMASVSSRSPRAKHCSLITLNHSLSETHSESILDDSWEESHSAPIQRTLPVKPLSSLNTNVQKTIPNKQSVSESEQLDVSGKSFEITLKNPRAWSPVRSVGSVLGMEAHPESDSSAFDGDSGLYCEDEVDQAAWGECDTVWNFVEAGGCIVDGYQLPHWFANSHTGPSIELTALWRLQLLKSLKSRNEFGELDLSKYGQAIEYKGWSRSGEARQIYPNGVSEDCVFSINWHSVENTGTLSVMNPDGATIKFILNLGEVTCVMPSSEPGYPRISIFTPRRFNDAIKLQFNSENEQEEWLNLLVEIMCQTNGLSGRPSSESVWAVTSLGDIITWDRQTLNSTAESNGLYTKEFNVYGKDATNGFSTPLHNNFLVGSELEIKGCLYDVIDKFTINLEGPIRTKRKHKLETEVLDIPLHFNPRFSVKIVVRNSKMKAEWGNEEREGEFPFTSGQEFLIKFVCLNEGYHIYINDTLFAFYRHRLPPEMVDTLKIFGQMKLYSIEYKSKNVIIGTDEMIWRIMGGHLRKVETSSGGVTWGISHDHTAWVYTGGWGGGILKGIESSSGAINNMTDTQNYFVYENQRWNPLTGYTSSGLPTDRYMWSDVTGRHKRTREHTKLLNKHWHWISEWIVDYNTPGGVDSDGWQYATDFPAMYHGRKLFTDCVRRRRWFRRSQLATAGPWLRAGNTAILDVSLWSTGAEIVITDVWAVATTGDAVYRSGVSADSPIGSSWLHVSSPQPLSAISIYNGVVWALGRKGEIYMRVGMTSDNPTGNCWRLVEAPKITVTSETKSSSGCGVRALTLSRQCAWILLSTGKIAVRLGIDSKTPAGKEWKYLTDSETTFKHISSGICDVWSISNDGKLYRRAGISAERPSGTSWNLILNAGCVHVSARGSFANVI